MGEGISAGMESGHAVAMSIKEHFDAPADVLEDYRKRIEMLKVYMQRQWHFVTDMSETFGEMRATI